MRPIIFSSEMVRAIFDGRKTQTRRPMKPQPNPITNGPSGHDKIYTSGWIDGELVPKYIIDLCPYGQPGDLLWVRETFAKNIRGCPDGLTYKADHDDHMGDGPANPIKWVSPRFMPQSASRITLKITDVRVQRIREISESDANAEGSFPEFEIDFSTFVAAKTNDLKKASTYRLGFKHLWDSIYLKKDMGWDANPYVWCISFEQTNQKVV